MGRRGQQSRPWSACARRREPGPLCHGALGGHPALHGGLPKRRGQPGPRPAPHPSRPHEEVNAYLGFLPFFSWFVCTAPSRKDHNVPLPCTLRQRGRWSAVHHFSWVSVSATRHRLSAVVLHPAVPQNSAGLFCTYFTCVCKTKTVLFYLFIYLLLFGLLQSRGMDLVEILSFLFQLSFSTLGRVSIHHVKYPTSLTETMSDYGYALRLAKFCGQTENRWHFT